MNARSNEREEDGKDGREVLVVENDPTVSTMIADVLGWKLGIRSVKVDSVEEALRVLSGGRFCAVVCDILLPGGRRGEAVQAFLERRGSPLAGRMVFMTGMNDTTEIEAFCHDTGNAFLRKPFSIDEIRHRK